MLISIELQASGIEFCWLNQVADSCTFFIRNDSQIMDSQRCKVKTVENNCAHLFANNREIKVNEYQLFEPSATFEAWAVDWLTFEVGFVWCEKQLIVGEKNSQRIDSTFEISPLVKVAHF